MLVDDNDDDIFAYVRSSGDQRVLVVCNFRDREVKWKSPVDISQAEGLVGNYERHKKADGNSLSLRPFEAFAVLLV